MSIPSWRPFIFIDEHCVIIEVLYRMSLAFPSSKVYDLRWMTTRDVTRRQVMHVYLLLKDVI